MSDLKQYTAGLCFMTERGLAAPHETHAILAANDDEAQAKAEAWAKTTMGIVTAQTWLQIMLNGAAVRSVPLTEPF
jgi:hypothetical protein